LFPHDMMTPYEHIIHAMKLLKSARQHLRQAGANRSAVYVSRALKSVEGSARHKAKPVGRQFDKGVGPYPVRRP